MSGLVKWMQSYNVVQKKLRRISLSTLRRGGGGACGTLSYKAKLVGDILGVYA